MPDRHSAVVRTTHWLTTIAFFALLVTGVEIVISHPRFYWGEVGNVNTPSLFDIPIPSSRGGVKTGYNYVLPDQNGWSRSLHFQAAWLVFFTALVYGISSFRNGHFRNNLLPTNLSIGRLIEEAKLHLKPLPATTSYNLLQRVTYLAVIFGWFPLMIWTGLAMSPAFTATFPLTVTIFGGHQSARTIHFFCTIALVLFVLIHIVMVVRTGLKQNLLAMTAGSSKETQ
jgi:thiosulfate reductase cytochrome b subunit